MTRIDALGIHVEAEEVSRLLGYPPGMLPARARDLIADVERHASNLCRPTGVYELFDEGGLAHSAYLRDVDCVVLALVTIGPGLEHVVDDLRNKGMVGAALVYDAFGSAAAEAAADTAEAHIREAIEDGVVRCSRRFSPGYDEWDVAEQRWIVPALDGADVGVVLSEGCMMSPRKSVTFAMTVGENPTEFRRDDNLCETCGVVNCEWRDTPERCQRRPVR